MAQNKHSLTSFIAIGVIAVGVLAFRRSIILGIIAIVVALAVLVLGSKLVDSFKTHKRKEQEKNNKQ